MEAEQFKDLLKRYEENSLPAAEKQMVDDWYASYATEEIEVFSKSEQASRIKAEMKAVIMEPAASRRVKLWRNRYSYAAIISILVPALLFFINRFSVRSLKSDAAAFTVYTTSATESKILTLQDQSIVHLNPSSTFRLSTRFGTLAQREVFLEKGNAFFEVHKDKLHPFIVHAQNLSTRVLGTKFKVSNTQEQLEVSVSEGRVRVAKGKNILSTLRPGKKLRYNKTNNHWVKSDFGIYENNTWYKSVTDLNHASFAELARVVKINYGVSLISRNPNTINYRYNLQIRSERNLEQTIQMICSVHRNSYRRTSDGIVIY